jgi:hypothetical protein
MGARILLVGLVGLVAACSGEPGQPHPPGSKIDCNGAERVVLDCRSEFAYQGIEGNVGFDVAGYFGMNADVADKALREVDQHVETYSAMHNRICRDYNACIVDPEEYRGESQKIRSHLVEMPTLLEALKKATSPDERMAILDRLYRGVVPETARKDEVTFFLSTQANIPGVGARIVAPGESIPTGSDLSFTVQASTDAYVYMFQVDPEGSLTVLFPEPRIGTKNPLVGKRAQRIPDSGQSFTLTGKPTVERVYFVVSRDPVPEIEKALSLARSADRPNVADSPVLSSIASVEPRQIAESKGCTRALELTGAPAAPAGATDCSRPRALQLSGDSTGPSAPTESSIAVRNRPGDDLIVEVFEFNHVAKR